MSIKKDVDLLEALVWRLGELDDALRLRKGEGGPLHIIVKDGNVRDADLIFCYVQCHEETDDPVSKALGLAMLHELMFLTEAQRFMWYDGAPVEGIKEAEDMRLVRIDGRYEVMP